MRFIEEKRADLAGIVLTHAHEDHIGAVIELWPRLKAPIYATPFTAGMLKSKLAGVSSPGIGSLLLRRARPRHCRQCAESRLRSPAAPMSANRRC